MENEELLPTMTCPKCGQTGAIFACAVAGCPMSGGPDYGGGASLQDMLEDDEDKTFDEQKLKYLAGTCFINIYLIDRRFGGPEEGGWWYEAGDVVSSTQVLVSDNVALDKALAWCMEENANRRSDIGSVLSEGRYVVRVELHPGEAYPQELPHYE